MFEIAMVAKLIIAEEAQQDIGQAYAWYEKQRVGLGEEYLSCVEACIEYISRTPESCSVVYRNFRRGLVRRFPFAVFYEFENGIVTVYSVFHNSRDPLKWKEQISK